jgi:hypothetical protein
MRIARVFPRRTKATPTDELAFTGPPGLFPPEVDAVHVSVAFTWDLRRAEQLAREWRRVAPVTIGGPAVGHQGEAFEPGQYVRRGYVITSRGCPKRCWFCSVWKRDGGIRELPICDGWNVLDDNLLACSDGHVREVVAMLSRQGRRAEFTGGLDYDLLLDWHVDLLASLKPRPTCFFAYDPGDELDGIREAGRKMLAAGWTRESHRLRCYVLIGFPRDSFGASESRLRDVLAAGFTPMAMLWRGDGGGGNYSDSDWRRFQRQWARPAIIHGWRRR